MSDAAGVDAQCETRGREHEQHTSCVVRAAFVVHGPEVGRNGYPKQQKTTKFTQRGKTLESAGGGGVNGVLVSRQRRLYLAVDSAIPISDRCNDGDEQTATIASCCR